MVVAETAGSLVETPEAGTESMPPDLADRTLSDSGWMTEELVAASETGFLFGAPEASSLVGTSEAGFLVVASETETLPPGTTPFCCCNCDRLVENSTNGAVKKGSLCA